MRLPSDELQLFQSSVSHSLLEPIAQTMVSIFLQLVSLAPLRILLLRLEQVVEVPGKKKTSVNTSHFVRLFDFLYEGTDRETILCIN